MATALLVLLAVTVLVFRFWMRLDAMSAEVADLTLRVRALERRRSIPAPVHEQVAPARPPVQPAIPGDPAKPRAAVPPVTPRATPPSVSPQPPVLQQRADERAVADDDRLETRIGSRWLLYVGVVAIIVGVAYFEKLAFDNHWVNETARVVQGAIVGLLLVAGGLRFVRKGYLLYGQILSGSGVAILYVSTYAAFNFYHLVSQPTASAAMTCVTILAAYLANHQRSQGLALVAVAGGFSTPFLLPTATDAEVALFGYDMFLIAGTMFLAHRRDWPVLNVVSYGATVLTFLAWANRFYPRRNTSRPSCS